MPEGGGSSAAASKSEIYATHRNKLGPEVAGKAKVSSTWNLQQLLLLLPPLLLLLPPMESGQRKRDEQKMSTTNENKPNQIYDVPSETMRSQRRL